MASTERMYSQQTTTTPQIDTGVVIGVLIGILLLAGLVVAVVQVLHKKRKSLRLERSRETVALKISLPKPSSEPDPQERRDAKEILGVMESIYASIQYFHQTKGKDRFWYGQPTFSFELVAQQSEIYFYVVLPRDFATQMERQIHAQYPVAHIEPALDHDLFLRPFQASAVGAVNVAKARIFPIRTYKYLENDPLYALMVSLTKVGTGVAAIQLLVQPTEQSWQGDTETALKNIQEGKSVGFKPDPGSKVFENMRDIGYSAWNGQPDSKGPGDAGANVRVTAMQDQQSKLLVEKGSKVGLMTQVRVLARASTELEAKQQVQTMLSSFTQYQSPESNSFKVANVDDRSLILHYITRTFSEAQPSMLLTTDELTSLFHFPNRPLDIPGVHWLGARKLSPPTNLPQSGLRLGFSHYRGQEMPIFLKEDDRMRHLYMIGKTGVGKTTIFQNMVIQDIRNGAGVCYMDPNGDAVDWILRHMPKERYEDVILFDPSDIMRPLALNLLEYDPAYPEQKSMLINEMMAVFDKLYDLRSTGGPMFEQYMRAAMLLVMDDPSSGSTLMEIPRVLTDPEFRKLKLDRCTNQVIKDFWINEAEKAGGEASLQNMVPYITSKLNQFTTNDILRPIIGQQKSALNFRDVMDNKKILLVSLPKGLLGEINQMLLGLIFTARIQLAAFSRQNIPEADRTPFYMYVDEFQDFTSKTFTTILAQARKYRLSLNITNQLLGQLDEDVRKNVVGNVGTTLVWRIGADDAEYLTKEFAPLGIDDMVNTEKFNFYVKMLIDGSPTEPFNATAYPPDPHDNPEVGEAVRQYSRAKYGRDRETVEAEIRLRAKGVL